MANLATPSNLAPPKRLTRYFCLVVNSQKLCQEPRPIEADKRPRGRPIKARAEARNADRKGSREAEGRPKGGQGEAEGRLRAEGPRRHGTDY